MRTRKILVYLPPLYGHVFPVVPTMLELVARGHEVTAHASGAIARALRPVINVIPGMRPPNPLAPPGSRTVQGSQEASLLAAGIRAVRPDVVVVHDGCFGATMIARSSGLPWVSVCISPLPEHFRARTPPPQAVLYYTAWPLEARLDLPDFVYLVGPALWEPSAAIDIRWLCGDERLILVTRSSHPDPEHDLLGDVILAFSDPSVRVVVTGQGANGAHPPVPAHISIMDYAPHMPLLRHAQCVITHAGPGVAQKALWTGVPMCVVPGGRDQRQIAAQLVATGAASRLPGTEPRAVALRAGVESALRLRSRAQAIATDWQSRPPGEKLAADVVERCAH